MGIAAAAPTADAAVHCGAGSRTALISGKELCLQPGETCALANGSQYRKDGYTCGDAGNGEYRLSRWNRNTDNSY